VLPARLAICDRRLPKAAVATDRYQRVPMKENTYVSFQSFGCDRIAVAARKPKH
jgi:hypothetical protein